MNWNHQHLVSIADCSRVDLEYLLRCARSLEQQPQPDLLAGRLMATLFFEPSTRTRLSFEAAMSKLGGKVIGFSDASATSAKKGESLADTIRMADQYADIIVLRHPREGSARLASEVSSVPIINGGDGSNQHPTQTALDLYTIDKLFPGLMYNGINEDLTIAFAGDLRYGRTAHSLVTALGHFNCTVLWVAPDGLELPQAYIDRFEATGKTITRVDNLSDAVAESHILYMTRLQEERFPDPVEFAHVKATYHLNAKMLEAAQDDLRILHPLPRVNEIATDVDRTIHAQYFAQAGNGVPVRQALLALMLGMEITV